MSRRDRSGGSDPDALAAALRRSRPGTREALAAVLNRYLPPQDQLEFLHAMLFEAADAIAIIDHHGHVLIVNRAFCELTGCDMGDVLGRPISELVPIDQQRYQEIGARLEEGIPQKDYEFILRREGVPTRVLSISITPLRAAPGEPYRLSVNVARDVTGRRELERQVIEWQERARQYLYALHPPEIAEDLVAGRLEARNLNVSVLFTDVSGFTHFTSQVPAAEVAHALHRYFTAMTQVILDHGGWVDKFVGDAVMALFGVPGGSPDHARQAARASVAMSREMRRLDLPWRHKVGIATGQVIAGDIGSRQKPTYTAIGDPVNLASRLRDIARPGEILLCPHTQAEAGSGFTYEALGELDIRGYGTGAVFRLLPPD